MLERFGIIPKGCARVKKPAEAKPKTAKAVSAKTRATPPHRIIVDLADIQEGVAALVEACPHMRKIHELAGEPPLRRNPGGFEGLARIIVGQQLSVASAAAIWGRTRAAVEPFTAAGLLALDDAGMRAAGLSGPKMRTLRAAAAAVAAKRLDFDGLADAPDEAVYAALTEVSGIGPWTADIYMMFCLGRADAWAPGDLALQIALQRAMNKRKRPDGKAMVKLAERWRPWRGVAARLLWSYYKVVQETKSGAPV